MASTITGMMKILYQNYFLDKDNILNVSSGDTKKENMYDQDKDSYWVSIGSDDTTTESIEVEFNNVQSINRLIIMSNFKQFNIQYDNSGWVDFSNVYSTKLDSPASSINYTNNAQEVRYFEFDTVTTTKIRIQVTKTFVIDDQKKLYEFQITKEIGTFIEDVTSAPNRYTCFPEMAKAVILTKSNYGSIRITKSKKYKGVFKIKELMETNDQNIINSMFEEGQFIIYPCGADNQYTQKGWRLQDFYNVVIVKELTGNFAIGRDSSIGTNQNFEVLEQ